MIVCSRCDKEICHGDDYHIAYNQIFCVFCVEDLEDNHQSFGEMYTLDKEGSVK